MGCRVRRSKGGRGRSEALAMAAGLTLAGAAVVAACSLVPLDYRTRDGGAPSDDGGTGGAAGSSSASTTVSSGGAGCVNAPAGTLASTCRTCGIDATTTGPCTGCSTATCTALVDCVVKGNNTPRNCFANVTNSDVAANAIEVLHCAYDTCTASGGPCNDAYDVGCFDSSKDGDESAIDCGGPLCAPCLPGLACESSCDCMNKQGCDLGNGSICCRIIDAGAFACP